jgi:hypothetical protein
VPEHCPFPPLMRNCQKIARKIVEIHVNNVDNEIYFT